MASINEQVCLDAEAREAILARLKRAEGQLRGVQKMIAEERSCQDLMIQLAAVKEAITQVGVTVLSKQLVRCLTTELAAGNKIDRVSEQFLEAFKKLA